MSGVSLEKAMNDSCNSVKIMMDNDNYDVSKRTMIITAINTAVTSSDYINSIKKDINQIKADGKFDANDLPSVFSIIFRSQKFLATTLKNGMIVTSNFDSGSMKYVVYGIIHFVMLTQNIDQSIIDQLTTAYTPLWELVAINPKDLLIKVDSCWRTVFPCCFACGCCKK